MIKMQLTCNLRVQTDGFFLYVYTPLIKREYTASTQSLRVPLPKVNNNLISNSED